MELNELFKLLNGIIPNQVYYGTNVYDDNKMITFPYIVYQEISKRSNVFKDDAPYLYKKNIQITLVSSSKNEKLEQALEQTLLEHNLVFTLLSEYRN